MLQRLATLAATDALGLEWEYRFPTVVGVRYQGAPDRVPDAGRLDVDRDEAGGIPTRLAIDVTVAGRTPATTRISSPSHSILCEAGPEGARVRFGEGERLDRDLVLRWPAAADGLEAGMVLGGGLAGDDGRYGLVTVTPPAVPRATFARDLTVLIDASGSMSGEPLACAKQVVQELLRGLDPQDRFELLVFSNQVSRLGRAMTPATPDALRRAQRALAELTAGGGTEMAGAISEALGCLRHDAQRQIVLVTDGQIGFEREVVAGIMNGLPDGCRVHAVGIGSAPNRSLTAAVARAGRGVELLVNDPVSAREGARRLGAATARPVITDVAIEGTALLRPATTRLRDVFAGQPLVAAVELRGHGGALELHGRLAGSAERWTWRIAVPEAGGASAATPATPLPIGALFGREAIADLELTLAASASNAEAIDAEIEALGLRHRITSRRTSLVAIAEEPTVDPSAPTRRQRIAAELPAGVSAQGSGLLGGGGETLMLARQLPFMAFYHLGSGPILAKRPSRGGPRSGGEELLRSLGAGRPRRGREVRDAAKRVQHELAATRRAIAERKARLWAAADDLMGLLAGEREKIERLAVVVRNQIEAMPEGPARQRWAALLGRMERHAERIRHLVEQVARAAEASAVEPHGADPTDAELEAALNELGEEDFTRTGATLYQELATLLERGAS